MDAPEQPQRPGLKTMAKAKIAKREDACVVPSVPQRPVPGDDGGGRLTVHLLRVRARWVGLHARLRRRIRPQESDGGEEPFHLYNYRRDQFLIVYHARRYGKSTFSVTKRLFGDTLRSKILAAQVNELLLNIIAHSIVCVVHSIFDSGVALPGFAGCAQTQLAIHSVGGKGACVQSPARIVVRSGEAARL